MAAATATTAWNRRIEIVVMHFGSAAAMTMMVTRLSPDHLLNDPAHQ